MLFRKLIPVLALIAAFLPSSPASEIPHKLPIVLRNYQGTLYGRVVSKDPKGLSFMFKTNHNPSNPEDIDGKEFKIRALWKNSAEGDWRPIKSQVAYIKKLPVGEEISITIFNDGEDSELHLYYFPSAMK